MGLVCWLPLQESPIINRGYGNITLGESNTTWSTSDGKLNFCRAFNGNNSTITLSGTDLYNCFKGGSTPFSLCFWIYNGDGNGSSNSQRAVYFGDYSLSGSISFNIEKTASGLARFYWASNPDWQVSGATITASAWSHLVFTYDGSAVKCYINGELKGTRSGTLATMSKTSGNFQLGRDSRTGDTAFNGRMNDFRVYNHCLSQKEIKDIYRCLFVYYSLNFEDQMSSEETFPTTASSWTTMDNSGYLPKVSFNNIVSNSDTASGSRSAKFNGTNSYIEKQIPGNSDAYTFMCWVKFDATGTYHLMDCRNTANTQGMQPLYCGLTYGIQFYSVNGGSLQLSASACGWSSSDTNKWFHIAGVITTTGCAVYINGVQVGTNTATKTNPTVWGPLPFRLGTRLNGSNWFNGKVADCRVYLSALSASDILDIYHTKAYILKDGSLHMNQYKEVIGTEIELPTKNYVVKSVNLVEGTSQVGLFKSNKTLKAKEIVEIV